MIDWLNERYISRAEHNDIVGYYRKLVARLHGAVKELQARADASTGTIGPEDKSIPSSTHVSSDQQRPGDNVIRFDFRLRRS